MRAFRAVRGKKILGIMALFLLLFLLLYFGREPLVRRLYGVKAGVLYQGQTAAGLLPEEVRALVCRGEEEFYLEPVDAGEDPEWEGGVIPHLTGTRLQVEETAARILAAGRGEVVLPVVEEIEPPVTLEDYPNRPVYRGNPEKGQVAFMINVAWGKEHLPGLLDSLEREGVRATFFLVGRWAEKNGDWVEKLRKRGHELASHGYDDRRVLKGLTLEENLMDIQRSLTALKEAPGDEIRFFSPHKGEYDGATLEAAGQLGLQMLLWSLDTADWLKPEVERMLERTVHKAFGGALFLMHPTESSAEYLDRALPLLREKGLEAVTVGELLNPSRAAAVEKGM